MSERWIFVDLDGPVLDVSARYHRLHQDVVRRYDGWPFPLSVYWEHKRRMVPEVDILVRCGLPPETAREAEDARIGLLESPEYLELDRPWPWLLEAVVGLGNFGRLALVTLRRDPEMLEAQLALHDLDLLFPEILCGPGDGGLQAKADLIRGSGLSFDLDSVLVGDTEVDVESGRALGLRTVALSCGIRTPELLAACGPDVVLEDLRQVPDWLDGLP